MMQQTAFLFRWSDKQQQQQQQQKQELFETNWERDLDVHVVLLFVGM